MSLNKVLYPISFEFGALNCVADMTHIITKRVIDIIGAILCLILFFPLLLTIVVVIKLTSRGPVLFKQKRIGFMGKYFYLLKFRSMYHDCSDKIHRTYIENLVNNSATNAEDVDQVAAFINQVDARTTWIGKFLRKTSLDELPQLFNVLRGEMSLVGPRPHPDYEVERYKTWYYKRLTVKPGITGLSKLHIRCTPEDYDEAMKFDVRYIDNWSLWLDFKILLKTIPYVICGKGAH